MAKQSYGTDGLAIATLIISILVILFLVFVAIYSYGVWQNKIPAVTLTQLVFWTSLVIVVILLGLQIYCVYRLATKKIPVNPENDVELVPVIHRDQILNQQQRPQTPIPTRQQQNQAANIATSPRAVSNL